jgi:hypothetical protein
MSALAAVGEISHDDWQVLKAHLAACASCRSVFADAGELHAKWLPEHSDFEIDTQPQSIARLRKAILKRVTKAGAQFSRDAQVQPRSLEHQHPLWPLWQSAGRLLWIATAASVLIVFAVVLFQRVRPEVAFGKKSAAIAEVNSTKNDPVAPTVDAQSTRYRQNRLALEGAVRASEAQRVRLQQQLDIQEQRVRTLQQSSADAGQAVANVRQEVELSRTNQAKMEAELTDLRSIQGSNEAVTLAQQHEIQELNQKLWEQSASVERERQLLSAGREIRDLISARNLHIIDVYDTDGHGKTSQAFGRVFYTEGRSLVFYAYDLSAQHPDSGKYAFYVWGKRDGAPRDIKSLGAFNRDDQLQKRWVLTITDPKVLAEIDSVFVTLDPTGRPGKLPTGKRLLSAFLGSPANHP